MSERADDLTTWTPKEIDRKLSAIYERSHVARVEFWRLAAAADKEKQRGPSRFRSLGPGPETADEFATRIAALEAKAEEKKVEANAILEEGRPFHLEFSRRGGWLRYYLVVSSANGHVHREMSCSTCNYRTGYSWLVDLADCVEDEMVAAYGVTACTTCFPNAPVHPAWLAGVGAKKEDPSKCSGPSGLESVKGSLDANRYRRAGRCRDCGAWVSVSKHGKPRAHKRAEKPVAADAAKCDACAAPQGAPCAPGCKG